MDIFVNFYSYYFKLLFKAEGYNKQIFSTIIKKLTDPDYFDLSVYDELLPEAFKGYSKVSENQIKVICESLINSSINWWENDIFKFDNRFVGIPMRKTYRIMFKGVDYQSGVGQELWNPAEIVCVLSTINPNHPNIVKSLKLITPGKKLAIKNIKKLIR
jgi:hypothetical protein